MKELAVIMPVYNEEGAIGDVLQEWNTTLNSLGIDFEIHAYNDGSKDRTLAIITELSSKHPRIVAHNKPNSGHGPTILTGYRNNVNQAHWLFQTDSDGEMTPTEFSQLWKQREGFDFLIGQRSTRVQPLPRRIISAISRWSVWAFFGKGVWDVNSPYRLMRTSAFAEVFTKIPDNTFAPNIIISGWAGTKKLRIFEHPVPHSNRKTGVVSIRKWKLFKAALRSFSQTIAFRFQ